MILNGFDTGSHNSHTRAVRGGIGSTSLDEGGVQIIDQLPGSLHDEWYGPALQVQVCAASFTCLGQELMDNK